jgi:uncharacterized protein YerC
MHESVPDLILTAWREIHPRLLDDPHDLARRLARRRKPLLMRPPRAWCIALRASDQRLEDAAHVAPSPHPSSFELPPSEHVTITPTALVKLTLAQSLAGEDLARAAKKLGTTPIGLRAARIAQSIRTNYVPARFGKPTPLLYTSADAFGIRDELDPNAHRFAPPDRAWGWTATFLHCHLPRDFKQQQLTRVAVYFDRTKRYADKSRLHPEDPRVDPPYRERDPTKWRIPPPPPDFIQYKWKGDTYVGYDWKAAEKNPRVRINYERHERRKAKQRAAQKRRRQMKGLALSTSKGSIEFRGWKWLCPHCGKTCRTIFMPAGPIDLLENVPNIPRLARIIDIPRTAVCKTAGGQTFACFRCHNIRRQSRVDRNAWNEIVSYLSAGLLYGHEVPRPDWFTPDRKRPYAPRPLRPPSARRQQVFDRLLKGWTYDQIAADLNVGFTTVHRHAKQIYKQHAVHGRRPLARKLGLSLPPAHHTHTPARRERVAQLLRTGHTYQQIATALGVSYHVIHHDVKHLRQAAPTPASANKSAAPSTPA